MNWDGELKKSHILATQKKKKDEKNENPQLQHLFLEV